MRIQKLLSGTVALAALVVAVPAFAAETVFTTDFDSTNFGPNPGYTIVGSYEGWTSSTNGLEIQFNNVAGQAYSGANLIEMDTFANSSFSRAINAGSYRLTYFYSDRPGIGAASNGLTALVNGTTVSTSPGGNGGGQTSWVRRTATFYTAAPSTLTFAAAGNSDGAGGYVDSISLAAAVPEPATWAMMIGGFGLVGGAMRRRAKGALAAA